MSELSLDNPLGIRAAMARAGIAPSQTLPYEDPEHGWCDPITDDTLAVRAFLWRLWSACLEREERDHA